MQAFYIKYCKTIFSVPEYASRNIHAEKGLLSQRVKGEAQY
jgi:hypothetical protein